MLKYNAHLLQKKRRGFIASAFLLSTLIATAACTDNAQSPSQTAPSQTAPSQTASSTESMALDAAATQASSDSPPALLTLSELLSADDVKTSLAQAAKTNDEELLLYWQETLLAAAEEVNLASNQTKLLSGPQGIAFLSFQGMKTNYQNDFEQAFFNFDDVDRVYADYPAFKDMHQQSKTLIQKRDALINNVAKELENSGFEGDAMAEAKLQWQQSMAVNRASEP